MNEERSSKKSKYETFTEFAATVPVNVVANYAALKQTALLANSLPVSYTDYESMVRLSTVLKLDTAQNKEMEGKVGIFFISGVPGAGKTDLATSFAKLAATKNWTILNAPVPQYPQLHDTEGLKPLILDCIGKNGGVRNLVVVLRGYHLARSYIEMVKADEEIAKVAVNRGLVTKVHAMNVFRNKYKELLPCLAENCARGLCSVVVVERGAASENRVEKALAILSSMQDNIVTMKMPRLVQPAFESLQSALLKPPVTLYGTCGYTFGRLFKSKYYVPKVMHKAVLKCSIPVQAGLFRNVLEKVLGEFVKSWEVALKAKEKVEQAKSQDKKMYVDTSEEQMILGKAGHCLVEYMEGIRAETEGRAMTIERMKGVFTEEGKEYKSNYSVRCNSTFATFKKLPEGEIDKEKLVLELYANNVELEQLRELMKLCRTQVCCLRYLIVSGKEGTEDERAAERQGDKRAGESQPFEVLACGMLVGRVQLSGRRWEQVRCTSQSREAHPMAPKQHQRRNWQVQ
eukprot:TRINITY_DN5643_c0_g4_i1.p1 TRINITY_DN5643_c0_g4~~TRINITY_DN5643_c0_g4_i1.p1  ORF type:complete len:515 (-),score=80.86 TRINITY_DN5643_c0_g4_i1:137-1681(-)